MKKLLPLLLLVFVFASCEKIGHKEKKCPVINSEQVPQAVLTTYNSNFVGATNATWYNDETKSYFVKCTFNGVLTKVEFDSNGSIQEQESENDGDEIDDDDDHGGHNDKNDGCECDLDEEED